MLLFMTNQLVGATAEGLNFVIYWYNWVWNLIYVVMLTMTPDSHIVFSVPFLLSLLFCPAGNV